MKKYKQIIKNKYFKLVLVLIAVVFCFQLYTNYLFDQLNNETPREAIVEFIYDETHSWKSFFIDIEQSQNVNDPKEDSLYYQIKYNGWYSIPGDLGGTIEVKKADDHYYVVKYIGYC